MQSSTAVFVWGYGKNQDLGNASSSDLVSPFRIKQLDSLHVRLVSTGSHFTLALTESGHVYAWGKATKCRFGMQGQLIKLPTRLKKLQRIKTISAGNWHSIAVNQQGDAFGAGHNNYGALGSGDFSQPQGFVQCCIKKVKEVSAGDGFTLFLDCQKELWSCGHKLRNGLGRQSNEPQPKRLMREVRWMSAGFTHSAAVSEQRVFVWGDNSYFQLGLGRGLDRSLQPVEIQFFRDKEIKQVTCSRGQKYAHSCALDKNGRVYTWGCGYKGKLGHYARWAHDDPADQPFPKLLTSVSVKCSRAVAAGMHTCLISEEGGVFSCGCGSKCRLGHKQSQEYTYLYREGIPRQIESLKQWRVCSLSCSYYHNAAVGIKR